MKQQARRRRGGRAVPLIGLAVACALPASTQAQVPAAAGGAFASAAATISAVSCETRCAGADAADHGSVVRLRGSDMRDVREVVFLGGAGAADDAVAPAKDVTATSVVARVPDQATTGPLLVRNGDGQASEPSREHLIVGEPLPEDPGDGPGTARLIADTERSPLVAADVESPTVYYAGARAARLRLTAKAPLEVTVALVRAADRAVVRRWTPAPLAAGASLSVTWDGTIAGKVPTRRGRYQFQVWRGGAAETRALRSAPTPEAAASFEFVPFAFPIAGRHQYGEAAAAFGGGRGHEGHDVFAACGTPLVAARGGVVKHRAYHARAGNYVVIDADGTGQDMAYMHLRDPALVDVGDRVGTGERIGFVGDTGRASGCHLHFELWTAPGWYSGGQPIDPLPALRAWDAGAATTPAQRRAR